MKIGLIGCGRWGTNILRDLRSLECTVHAVARSSASAERARAGGASVHDAIEDLPKDLDGIVVATLTSTHYAVLKETLQAFKCPVFCEKPLAPSSNHAKELHDMARERLFVMDKWRYHPGVAHLASLVKDRTYGRTIGVKTLRVQNGNPHPDVASAWTYLPHDIAIVREILGRYPDYKTARGDAAGELSTMLLGSSPWAVIEFSTLHSEKKREVRLYMEGAVAVIPGHDVFELEIFETGATKPTVVPFSRTMPLLLELREFMRHLNGGPPPKSGTLDAIVVAYLVENALHEGAVKEATVEANPLRARRGLADRAPAL